ncbi:MAG: DegT/DnrJ/EryC1/StrS family aminotransferase, partial [Candidatus Hydrogenedentes bacterium]|nr:DegT/DnrJ/EryC1/StrS family aminotransferase [Candidatus Hydrogenedentota bacterium]
MMKTNEPLGITRRGFIQTSSVMAAGLALGQTARAAKLETLAVNGGKKAVTVPAEKIAALTRWPRYGKAEKQRLHELIESNKYYDELPLFEDEWKAYTGVPFAKAHMNGSSALTSMYFALNLPVGSEVMVPSYTFFSACLALRFFGLVPVFVDIDPKTACFDLEDAKRKLTPQTKAVEAMHSWGLPCEMDRICEWCNEKGLIPLEDAAHAHGAEMQGKKVGTWGQMGIYSFQTTKVMPAIEGGMGMYQTREYFERAAAFGHYEDPVKFPEDSPVRAYEGTGFGQKYRMHPFAAAVARQQLKVLDKNNAVPSDVRLQVWLAFGFLAVCLLNTVGLLLAKFLGRSSQIGVRRALGATRKA